MSWLSSLSCEFVVVEKSTHVQFSDHVSFLKLVFVYKLPMLALTLLIIFLASVLLSLLGAMISV